MSAAVWRRTVAASIAAAAMLTACGSLIQPVQRLESGERVNTYIQIENRSPTHMVLHSEHSDQSAGDVQIEPCSVIGARLTDTDGLTMAAPFTIRLGPGSIQDGEPRLDYESMPVVLDSSALSPPPGRAGYRMVIDVDGNASLEPLDVLVAEPMADGLC